MKQYLIIGFAALVGLTGCTTYHGTLEEKLAGKPTAEKRTILAKECEQEVRQGLKESASKEETEHFKRIERICEEMTGKKID